MDLFSTNNNDPLILKLERDLVFFDVESTGLNVLQDRIIQIALIKYFADGRPLQELELVVNPKIPISKEASDIHGYTADMLLDKPGFEHVAKQVYDFIGEADLAGYNSDRFDLPLLAEELYRHGFDLDLDTRRTVDVQKIYYKMEPRTLKAAYRYFCNKSLEGAHDALADVRATVDVFLGQLKKYEGVDYEDAEGITIKNPIVNDIAALHDFLRDDRSIDFTQRLKKNSNGEIVFNFGKYLNQKVEDVLKKDRNYYHWIMEKDFSSQVKKIVAAIMNQIIEKQNNQLR